MEQKAQALMAKYKLNVSEAENAIDFIEEFLEELRDHTKVNEPYAIKSIQTLDDARKEVNDLRDFL